MEIGDKELDILKKYSTIMYFDEVRDFIVFEKRYNDGGKYVVDYPRSFFLRNQTSFEERVKIFSEEADKKRNEWLNTHIMEPFDQEVKK